MHGTSSGTPVVLSGMGGLVTLAKPESVPEGASPRTYDTDFDVGSEKTRAGLTSVYSFSGGGIGPQGGSSAADVVTTGNTWVNPSNILANDGSFTTSAIDGSVTPTFPPTTAVSQYPSNPDAWINPANALGSSVYAVAPYYTVYTPPPPPRINLLIPTDTLILSGMPSVPAGVTTGTFTFSFQAYADNAGAIATLTLSTGETQTFTLTTAPATYSFSVSDFDYSLLSSLQIFYYVTGPLGDNGNAYINTALVTLAYISPAQSDQLLVTRFGFSIPSTSSITGIAVNIKGHSPGAIIHAMLLKAGTPIGNDESIVLPASNAFVALGGATDSWGTTWVYSDLNSLQFGVMLWAESSIATTAYLDYVDILVNVSPSSVNFQTISTFTEQNGTIKNILLDASGNLYVEDVTNNPGVLTLADTGITPGSHAVTLNGPDVDYMAFTDCNVGVDMPQQYTPNWIDRITQVGPSAAPSFSPIVSTTDTFAIASITQGPKMSDPDDSGHLQAIMWSAGPSSTAIGNTVTVFYGLQHGGGSLLNQDPLLTAAFNSGQAVYVYMSSLPSPFSNGTYQAAYPGTAHPPGGAGTRWYFTYQVPSQMYKLIGGPDDATGYYQQTVATLTTINPVPGLTGGNKVTIAGASVSAWDNTWNITQALNSAQLTISETVVASSVATYSWNVSQGAPPVAGQLVTITGTTNANGGLNGSNLTIDTSTALGGTVSTSGTAVTWINGANFSSLSTGSSILINGAPYTVQTVVSSTSITLAVSAGTQVGVPYFSGALTSGTFTIPTSIISASAVPEDGYATTAGTIFNIDPGVAAAGSSSNPIFGNSTGGTLTFVGADAQLISAGTKQGTVFFITRNGYYTAPAPPVTFTIPQNTLSISAANILIGPPNVIARGIALTDSGQNGTPGGNFFTIPQPVQYVVNNITYTSSALIINDNTATSATFTFSDAVLLTAQAIDIYGYNLFNQIEIGDPAWVTSYDSRNWYGKCLNKIQNFNNLSFDGGYLAGQTSPLGWTQADAYGALVTSPKFGNAYYIKNTTSGTLSTAGAITQTAFQDAYQQPILNGNTAYSVRVTCSNPSGHTTGNLVISLVAGGVTYGSFTLALSAMSSLLATYTGTLLVNELATIPPTILLQVAATGLGVNADVLIDRIDIYPTAIPVLATTVYGSYAGLPEQVDAITGAVKFESENQQPVNGAVVLYDTLYGLKGWGGKNPGSSLYALQKSSNLEPAQWDEPEVAQRTGGAIGPLAFDSGEQWFVAASRAGLYLFVGGQPGKIMQEIYQIWDAINWSAGNTIWVKVDIIHRRLYVGIPLPTPNFWLPNAAVNANPTSPNVILMCNYQGLDTGEALKSEPQMHTTMFGTLNAIDMRRKWSIWQIPSPYANFVAGPNDEEFYICNGRGNSKVYKLDPTAETDDGIIIDSLYTTAGLVGLSKRLQEHGFGYSRMRWGYMVAGLDAAGNVAVTLYPNRLLGPGDPPNGYNSWQLPGGFSPGSPALNNAEASLNFSAVYMFIEFRENDGHGFSLSNLALHAKADPWNKIRGIK